MAASQTLKRILAGVVLTVMMAGGAAAGPSESNASLILRRITWQHLR